MAFVLAVCVVAVGYNLEPSGAAGPASLYLQPSGGTHTVNDTFTVEVRLNTGGEDVNAVQADLTYTASKLKFLGVDYTGSAFVTAGPTSGGSGSVSIVRGSITNVNGAASVAKITFKALQKGTAVISFSDSSVVVRTSDTSNVLGSTTGGSYTIKAASTSSGTGSSSSGSETPGTAPSTTGSGPTSDGEQGLSTDTNKPEPQPNDDPTDPVEESDTPPTPTETVEDTEASMNEPKNQALLIGGIIGILAVPAVAGTLFLRKRGLFPFTLGKRQTNTFGSVPNPTPGFYPPEVYGDQPPSDDQPKRE